MRMSSWRIRRAPWNRARNRFMLTGKPGTILHHDPTMTDAAKEAIDIQLAEGARLSSADTAALDAIFFAASNTREFASKAARHAFRARWLGRYLSDDPSDLCILARSHGDIVGYAVGTTENAATAPRFADIGYYQTFAPLCVRFPAHLHINLAPAWRSRGIGQRMIEAFACEAAAGGAQGVHVVTSESARNVGFYERAGFTLAGCAGRGGLITTSYHCCDHAIRPMGESSEIADPGSGAVDSCCKKL